jgi:integrase
MYTDLAISRLGPDPKKPNQRRELPDAGAQGLYITVEPSGTKGFALRFRRPDGRNARLVLGRFDPNRAKKDKDVHAKPEIGGPLLITEARLMAGRINLQRAGGADVISDRKADKIKRRLHAAADKDNAFGPLVRRYFEEHARLRTRRWIEAARYFGLAYREAQSEPTIIPNGLCDRWADRPVAKIGPADIKVVVDETIRRATPGHKRKRAIPRAEATGRAMHARLSAFFGWCVDDMRIESNPCSKLRRPPPSKSRDRVLSDDELRKVWIAADGLRPQYAAVVRLLVLTGQRLREVGQMRWSELSADLSVWSLPAERVKNARPHTVPLSDEARAIIKAVPRTSEEYVFSLGGDEPLESFSLMKRKLDALAGIAEPWTLHDLRRSLATGFQRLGVQLPVTEAVLNHRSGSISGVAAVYSRHDYADEKRAALASWATHVVAMVEGRDAPANVIEMAGRR